MLQSDSVQGCLAVILPLPPTPYHSPYPTNSQSLLLLAVQLLCMHTYIEFDYGTLGIWLFLLVFLVFHVA